MIGGSGRRTVWAILLAQVASPLVLILVVASLVSLLVGDDVTAGIIAAIIVMSGTLGFVQEARSESAVAALQARLSLHAAVVRDGVRRDVPIHEVVRGDLVMLSAGDIVPADVANVAADHLYIDEASLTGESAPSTKAPRSAGTGPSGTDDHSSLGFFGTSVIAAIIAALAAAVIIPLSPLGPVLGFAPLPAVFWLLLIVLVAAYLALVEFVKRRFEPRAEPARVISAAEPPAERSGQ